MAVFPRKGFQGRSLAGWLWLASAILGGAVPAMAQPAQSPASAAAQLYFDGKAVSARESLIQSLEAQRVRVVDRAQRGWPRLEADLRRLLAAK